MLPNSLESSRAFSLPWRRTPGLGLLVDGPLEGWESCASARDSGGEVREDTEASEPVSDESSTLAPVFGDEALFEDEDESDLAFCHSFLPDSFTR